MKQYKHDIRIKRNGNCLKNNFEQNKQIGREPLLFVMRTLERPESIYIQLVNGYEFGYVQYGY